MENELKKKYGLPTAIAMVVGIVIGSGIFFKQERIMELTGGNLSTSVLAWLIGGAIMVVCAYVFSILATRYEKVNGLVDYAEAGIGGKYAYFVGWFMTTIYYPTLTAVLCWLSARYTCELFGFANPAAGAETFAIAAFFMVAIFALNALSPKLSGYFQVSTTAIKLVPLVLVGVVGLIVGLVNGVTIDNFTKPAIEVATKSPLLAAVVATAFAYEGWIIATSINAEIKDSKKNLPKALVIGSLVVVSVYILYNIGLAGGLTNAEFIGSNGGAINAMAKIFNSPVVATILTVFVVISCLGTCNGLMLGCTRGLYSIASRGQGPKPTLFAQVDKETNMPNNAAIFGLLLVAAWLLFWFGNLAGWYGVIGHTEDGSAITRFIDISELPIVTIYVSYIPIFISMMIKMKGLHWFKRFLMPSVAILGSLFMLVAAVIAHGWENILIYLAIFAVITAIGALLLFVKKKPIDAVADEQIK